MILLGTAISGCLQDIEHPIDEPLVLSSYRDIPGLTQREIDTIEDFRNKGVIFTFGMVPSTEAFINTNGKISGATSLMCSWLTEFFEIPFDQQTSQALETTRYATALSLLCSIWRVKRETFPASFMLDSRRPVRRLSKLAVPAVSFAKEAILPKANIGFGKVAE